MIRDEKMQKAMDRSMVRDAVSPRPCLSSLLESGQLLSLCSSVRCR